MKPVDNQTLENIIEFNNELSEGFCVLPFMSVSSNPTGDFRLCSIDKVDHPNIPDVNKGDTFISSWNSEYFKEARAKIKNGEWLDTCYKCKKYEESNCMSKRMYANHRFKDAIPEQLANCEDDGTMNTGIRYWDLKISNLCNLNCRLCSKEFSSKHGPLLKWKNDSGYTPMSEIDELVKSVDSMFMTGGEPFMIKEYVEILEKLVELDKAKDIVIAFTTNGTLPPRTELLSHFKEVYINPSIDDLYERCEFIRSFDRNGYTFDLALENIEKYQALPNSVVKIHSVVQNWTVWNYPDSFLFWKERGIDMNHCHNILVSPDHLNIQSLPLHMKNKIKEKYQAFISNHDNKEFDLVLNGLVEYMFKTNLYSPSNWDIFLAKSEGHTFEEFE